MEEKIVIFNQQDQSTPKMQEAFMRASEAIGEKVPGALRVMTFNAGGLVKPYRNPNAFNDEKIQHIAVLVDRHQPDVFCIQESKIPRELLENKIQRTKLFMHGYTLYCKAVSANDSGFVNHGQLIYVKKETDAQYIELGTKNNAICMKLLADRCVFLDKSPASAPSLDLRTFANDDVHHGHQAVRVAECAKRAIDRYMASIISQATKIAAEQLARWIFNVTNCRNEHSTSIQSQYANNCEVQTQVQVLQSKLLQDKSDIRWTIGSIIQLIVGQVLQDAISQPLHAPYVQYYWSVLDAIKISGSMTAVDCILTNVFDAAASALVELIYSGHVSTSDVRAGIQQKTFKAISLKLPMLTQTIGQFVYKDTLSATTIVLGVISKREQIEEVTNAIKVALEEGHVAMINCNENSVKSAMRETFRDFIRESEADIVRKLISGVVRNKKAMNQLSEAALQQPNNDNWKRARWFALAAALMQIVENDSQEFLGHKLDMEGRLMVLKFPKHKLVLVSAYVFYNNLKKELLYPDPAAQPNYVINERRIYDAKIADFLARVKQQNPDCDLVYAGDMNATVLHYNDIVMKTRKETQQPRQPRQQQSQVEQWQRSQPQHVQDVEQEDKDEEYEYEYVYECDDEDTEHEILVQDRQDYNESRVLHNTLSGCNPFLVQSLQALLTSNALSLCDPFQPSGTNPKLATIMNNRFPNDSRCSKIDHIFTPRNRATQNAAVIVTQELVNIIRDANQQSFKAYVENASDHLPIVVDILSVQETASPTPKQSQEEAPSAPAAKRPCIKIYKK